MRKSYNIIYYIILFWSLLSFAGLPPTTTKDSGDSSPVTTFNFNFPNFTVTHTGVTTTFNILGIPGGGTGLSSTSQNFVFAGPTSGSGAPTWRLLTAGDIPSLSSTYLPLTGGTMSGAINMGSNKITSVTDPTSAQDAATKNYVDTQLAQLNPAQAVFAASTANIVGTYTNAISGVCVGDTFTVTATGALSLDGTSPGLNARVLLKNQTSAFQNGVWTVTVVGATGISPVLTRASDFDTSADLNAGSIVPVVNGTVNAGSSWYQTATISTCSSDSQTWTQFQKASSAYLQVANNLSDVNSKSASFNNISPLTTSGDILYGGASGAGTRLGANSTATNKYLQSVSSGTPSWQQVSCGDLSNSATSCSTDATNASNISSGSLAIARLSGGTHNQWMKSIGTAATWVVPNQAQKNYLIAESDFENNATTGWTLGTTGTLTNGLPTGSPTFGSGADANLSISTVSSGQLAGTYSLSYSEASSHLTVAGNMMASSATSIDIEDQAKVMTVKFYYEAQTGASQMNLSGTSSNSFAWAVWDATNSVWLSSAGNFCMNQSSGIGYCTGTFQTGATTASIRFVFYNANATSASSTASTLYLDDFYVGPQTAPIGPAMSDWVSYTPTGSWSTNTTYSGKWRRIGDSMMVQVGISLSGAPTSTSLTINMPTGYTIDTTKIPGTVNGSGAIFGTWSGVTASSNTTGQIEYDSTTAVQAYYQSSTSAAQTVVNATNPLTWANTNVMWANWIVPIVGWSSNSTASSDTDTRVISLLAHRNSASATANTTIGSWTTDVDRAGAFVASTGVYTVPVSGDYYVNFYNVLPGSGSTQPVIFHNGSSVANGTIGTAGSTDGQASALIPGCLAGDTITVQVSTTATIGPSLNIFRLSGPSVVTATESVNMSYSDASGGSIGTSAAAYAFGTKLYDSHNEYSGSTYTVPVSGKYRVNAHLSTSGVTLSTSQNFTLFIYHNGSQYTASSTQGNGASSIVYHANVTGTVSCLTGDTIQIFASSSVGTTAQAAGNINLLSIERVGN